MPTDAARILAILTRNAEEVVTPEEAQALAERLARGEKVTGYIGFEPSGRVHLGWMLVADKIRDLAEAGVHMRILLADWHAQINDKLGGDLEKIRACGRYMEHCFAALGVPNDKVEYVYATDVVSSPDYWAMLLKVSKTTSLARVKRAMDIMGRTAEEGEKDFSKFIYPGMQVTDIFYMGLDIAYGGLDQRHAHMLARDVADKLGWKKPLAIHTPLLPGLKADGRMDPIEAKMSKSDPDSGIMIHDPPADVKRKINKAFCPEKTVEGNPVIALAKHVVFPRLGGKPLVIDRPAKFGGPLTFATYAELEGAFASGGLHPMDLKNGVAAGVSKALEPVAAYFAEHPEPLAAMQAVAVTR